MLSPRRKDKLKKKAEKSGKTGKKEEKEEKKIIIKPTYKGKMPKFATKKLVGEDGPFNIFIDTKSGIVCVYPDDPLGEDIFDEEDEAARNVEQR